MDIIGTRNVRNVLEYKASQSGNKEFIVFEDSKGYAVSFTYREFDEMVNRHANILMRKGIKKGDKVTIHLMNSPEYLFSFFALAKIGAVIIPTNILSGAQEMEYYLDFSDSVGIITEPCYADLFSSILDKCKKVRHLFLVRTSPWYPNARLYPDATIIADEIQDAPTALPEVAYEAGLAYIQRFLPGFYVVRRDLYKRTSGSAKHQFKAGYRSAEVANWQGAIEIWDELTKHRQHKTAGRAQPFINFIFFSVYNR